MRAEKYTEEIMKARQQRAQSVFQFCRSGSISTPSSPSGNHDKTTTGVTGYFKERRRSRRSLSVNMVGINTSGGALQESNEECNYDTTRSLKSLFSAKSSTKFKSDPSSCQAEVRSTGVDKGKGKAILRNRSEGSLFGGSSAMAEFTSEVGPSNRTTLGYLGFPTTEKRDTPSIGRSLTEHQVQKAAMALRRQKKKQLRLEQKRVKNAERAAKAEKTKTEKHEIAEVAARAVPPKEVAFGDRKLFMSFLSIVRDPIQRLSDSCSRVMLTMERELASGLNVESGRIERLTRRNAARTAAVRNAEATGKPNGSKVLSKKGSMLASDKSSEPTVAPVGGPLQGSDRPQQCEDPWSRVQDLMGIKKLKMAQEEIEYAEALKAALDKGKRVKEGKDGLSCQNILDRMVSMRMAAQLLSPEVRDLVTGPMNYYRRDMVGALLLYFSVLSSSLASKTPLPPYLPSARMARLRVIYNVRMAIEEHQAATSQNHYTYIYYYAFSSALEEVIEELELLAILIKPIVGITLVTSGDAYAYGFQGNQINDQPEQYDMPAQSHHQQELKNSDSSMLEQSSSMSGFLGANNGDCASGPNIGSGTLPPPRILVQPTNDVHPDLLLEHERQGGVIPNSTLLYPQTGTASEACQTVPADTSFTRSMGYIPELDPMQMPFSAATGSPTQRSKNFNMAVPVTMISSHPTAPTSPVIVMDEILLETAMAVVASVGQAPEMDIGSLQTGLSAGSPLISGKVLPSGTVSSITGGGESSLKEKISLRLAGAKEKLLSGDIGGNDGTQSTSDQEGLRLNTEHQPPQEVHLVRTPLPESHGDIAEIVQVFEDAHRSEASPRIGLGFGYQRRDDRRRPENQEQTRKTGEETLDALALPPSAVASPKSQHQDHH
ncbi:hypothetical protein BGZ59_004063 [Podila verticillata]|nr:hypothetical protein BGZ59_004063 [Podila verticillata]